MNRCVCNASRLVNCLTAALALIACVANVGCRLPGRKEKIELPTVAAGSNIEPGEAQGVVAASAVSDAPQSRAGNYTIALAVFIPNNHVLAPAGHPQSFTGLPPKRLVFSGDDRDFDVDAVRYRAKQVVTLVPDETLDPDGLCENSKLNLGGLTESFLAEPALKDGKIDVADHYDKGLKTKHESVPVDVRGMLIDDPIRLGPQRVSVRLHTARSGGPRDQLIAGAPSIDWDFTITIDTSNPDPRYEISGKWDGYPAMEIYVNRQPIYQYRGADRAPTMGDLLKLAPLYGDLKVNEVGSLTPR